LNQTQNVARDRAATVLQHYIEVLFNKVGATYDTDTAVEIESLVDDIILAAKLPSMTAHEAAVAGLRRMPADDVTAGGLRLHDGAPQTE
jgi:hypothetical protein